MKKLLSLFLLAFVLILSACGSDEPEKETPKEAEEPVEKEVKKTEPEEDVKEEPKENTIKVDEEIELRNLNFNIQTITIEKDKVTIPMNWNHWASNEKVHLTVLAYPVVKQGDDELEMTGGEDSLLRQTAKGVDSRIEVEYQLIDDETPITITMKTTADDPEEDSITVDIK